MEAEPLGSRCVHPRGTHSCGREDDQGQNPNICGTGRGGGLGGGSAVGREEEEGQ